MAARSATPDEITTVLYLTNVHCADCVRDMIDAVLHDKDGVTEASYDAATGALSVTYRPEIVGEEEIRETISELGYGFAEESAQAGRDGRGSTAANVAGIVAVVIVLVVVILIIRSLGG